MGHTLPPFSQQFKLERTLFAEMRRALLLRDDKAFFDDLWNKAEFHVPAAEKAKHPLPITSILLSMNLEQEKASFHLEGRLLDQSQRIQQLEDIVKTSQAQNVLLKGEIESLRWEMDLRMEGAAASELHGNFEDDPMYVVPTIDWERTGRRVLTTEWISGIPVHDLDELVAAGHDLEAIVRKASESFFLQVFRDGFFHADMHPGNAFVRADGALCVVDFGIMGRIDRRTRYFLADMLLGFVTGDYERVADVHFQANSVPAGTDRMVFHQALRAIGEPIFDRPPSEISIARLLAQLFQVSERFDMEAQPELLLLQKTMLLAEGVGRRLAPELNMWHLALPLVEEWMREHRGPEARLAEITADVIHAATRLPKAVEAIEQAATRIADGEVRLDLGRTGAPQWPVWVALAVLTGLILAEILG